MKLLFVSNLYPNAREPMRGIFNAQQVAALSRYCEIVKVIAPVAASWRRDRRPQNSDSKFQVSGFRLYSSVCRRVKARGVSSNSASAFSPQSQVSSLPSAVCRLQSPSFPIVHPPFRTIPILSRPFNGWLFARSIEPHLRPSTLNSPPSTFDIVLVNWAYPDAYGVMLLAKKYGFSYATTVQGSDVNLLFRNRTRKKQVLAALRNSKAVFCRSRALQDTLAKEGITATTVYNGIDRDLFHPLDRAEACRQLGLPAERRRILYVGNLQVVKGPTVLAEAYAKLRAADGKQQTADSKLRTPPPTSSPLPPVDLVFLGDGPEHDKIARISNQKSAVCSLHSQVYLMGARPHHEIPLWLNACDVLCLPSFNEGLPNVVLEALACGTPVVASNVGGVPEIIRNGENGLLVPPGNPDALVKALQTALDRSWNRAALVDSVKQFDWNANARKVVAVLESALQSSKS